jgi:hypothetical protein
MRAFTVRRHVATKQLLVKPATSLSFILIIRSLHIRALVGGRQLLPNGVRFNYFTFFVLQFLTKSIQSSYRDGQQLALPEHAAG